MGRRKEEKREERKKREKEKEKKKERRSLFWESRSKIRKEAW